MTNKFPSNIASLIIDAQPTFCEGGGLGVDGGNAIMPKINQVRDMTEKGYKTQDWHPKGHVSFASTHGRDPFTMAWIDDGKIVDEYVEGKEGPAGAVLQMFWPDHGIQEELETEIHPDLTIHPGDLIMKKGNNPKIDSYSCVFENDKVTRPRFKNGNTLPEQLHIDGIDTVLVSGIALDVCVRDGACDLKAEGFRVVVVIDATAAISEVGLKATLERFKVEGVEVTTLAELPGFFNKPAVAAAPKNPGAGPA